MPHKRFSGNPSVVEAYVNTCSFNTASVAISPKSSQLATNQTWCVASPLSFSLRFTVVPVTGEIYWLNTRLPDASYCPTHSWEIRLSSPSVKATADLVATESVMPGAIESISNVPSGVKVMLRACRGRLASTFRLKTASTSFAGWGGKSFSSTSVRVQPPATHSSNHTNNTVLLIRSIVFRF